MSSECKHENVEIEDVQPDSESGVCLDCGVTVVYVYNDLGE